MVFKLSPLLPSPPVRTDPSQQPSLVAVVGAVTGAVLALFLVTVFSLVILIACRTQPPTYCDKV